MGYPMTQTAFVLLVCLQLCVLFLKRLDEEEVRSRQWEINQHAQGEKVRETTRSNRHQIHSKEQSVPTKTVTNFPNRTRQRLRALSNQNPGSAAK